VGCQTGRKYRVYYNMLPPNVYEIDDVGHREDGLVFRAGRAAREGRAQKIALETNEHSALAVAN
jgi:hypothetical protein